MPSNIPSSWSNVNRLPLAGEHYALVCQTPPPYRDGRSEPLEKPLGILPNGYLFLEEDGPQYGYRPDKLALNLLPKDKEVRLVWRVPNGNQDELFVPASFYYHLWEYMSDRYCSEWFFFGELRDGRELDPMSQTAEFTSQESAIVFHRRFPTWYVRYKIPVLFTELGDGIHCYPDLYIATFHSQGSAEVFIRRHNHWEVRYTEEHTIKRRVFPEDAEQIRREMSRRGV